MCVVCAVYAVCDVCACLVVLCAVRAAVCVCVCSARVLCVCCVCEFGTGKPPCARAHMAALVH